MDHAPGAPRYEGKLLNPAEYHPQVPQMQPVPQHKDPYADQVAVVTYVIFVYYNAVFFTCCNVQLWLYYCCYWSSQFILNF